MAKESCCGQCRNYRSVDNYNSNVGYCYSCEYMVCDEENACAEFRYDYRRLKKGRKNRAR